jgi:outer membrane protein
MRQKTSTMLGTALNRLLSCSSTAPKILTVVLFAALPVFTLSGCRNIDAPSVPYEQWQPPKKVDNLSSSDNVWTGIRSRTPGTMEPLTLAQLLGIAFDNSPVTSRAWKDVQAKRAVLGQKKSGLFPQVTVSAEGRREKSVANTGAESNENQLRYGPSGRAELLLFDFGERDAAIEAAYQDMLSAGFAFNQSLQDLILDVQTAYYGLFSAYAILEAAESDTLDAKEALDAARMKFQAGIVSKLDQLQAEAGYNNALYNLEDAKGTLMNAKAYLATVIGFTADTDLQITRPDKELPSEIREADIREIIDQALSGRPDIAAARARLIQRQQLVREAQSSLWPTVNIGGTYGHEWYKYYNVKQPRDDSYDYSGYLSLSWDMFDGFDKINKKLEAEAESEAELENLRQLELQASADVWTKYYNYNTAVRKLEFSKAYLESSAASHDLALEGYSEGLKSMLDLLQAQSALSSARARFVDSEKDLFIAVAGLAHATGSLSAE